MTVFEMTVDSIFICVCEDYEQNDGMSRPYFMSKGLMKIMREIKGDGESNFDNNGVQHDQNPETGVPMLEKPGWESANQGANINYGQNYGADVPPFNQPGYEQNPYDAINPSFYQPNNQMNPNYGQNYGGEAAVLNQPYFGQPVNGNSIYEQPQHNASPAFAYGQPQYNASNAAYGQPQYNAPVMNQQPYGQSYGDSMNNEKI
jgi:hypothetical protein